MEGEGKLNASKQPLIAMKLKKKYIVDERNIRSYPTTLRAS